jgi:hypothetical protein
MAQRISIPPYILGVCRAECILPLFGNSEKYSLNGIDVDVSAARYVFEVSIPSSYSLHFDFVFLEIFNGR